MPTLRIFTNLKKDVFKEDFLLEASATFQAAIGKPMQYIAVHLNPDQLMAFGGSTDPCAIVEVFSAGKIGPEENVKYTETITEMMAKVGISSDRMYVHFTDIPRDNCGYKGTTLTNLAAKK